MDEKIKFSVLMSIYDKEKPKYFEEALRSILYQEIVPTEILIVEDGKLTKELYDIIKKYKKKYKNIITLKLEKNLGLGEALRRGVLSCKNEIIARMDTDDIAKPDRFKKQLEVLKNNSDIDMVGSLIEEFEEINNERKIRGLRIVPEKHEEIVKVMKKINPFNHPTVVFKKSKVIGSGNYSEKYNKLEDYYLWFRMAKNNCKFYNIQESLLYFRISNETLKKRRGISLLKNTYKLYREFYSKNFINLYELVKNIIIWSLYRILPLKMVKYLKNLILRKVKI